MDSHESATVGAIKDVNSSVKPHQLCSHHKSCGALAESADNGCHLCSILLSRLQSEMPTEIDIQGISALDHGIKQSASCLQIRILVRLQSNIRRIGLRNLQVNDVRVTPSLLPLEDAEDSLATEDCREQIWRTTQDNAKLSVSTASDATFELSDTWIRHCLSNHHACKEIALSDLTSPTRLLDLQGDSTDDDVQLRLTKDLPRNINTRRLEYVTLSHRWGLSPTLCLLEGPDGTVARLTASIPLTDLPLTFRNAAVITRRLGYRYLWIDSLCIIQNSASDWAAESAIMGEIYRGSVFTIAALGAKDSYEGCFKSRNPLSYIPCLINPVTHVKLRKAWDPVRLSGELLTRGCVIQERVLSPRTLFYGSSGIYWECVQSQRTQDGLVNFGETPKADFCQLLVPCESSLDIDIIKNPSEPLIAFYKSWVELLQSYSSTRLTKQTDKLVAFQGIILSIARNRHYTSVAEWPK
ncbi:heterokaryon incompatibility protein-domain-containing protein, partial [Rhexocercosporidium sp. MPI-PUGE-AT-0058]